MPSKISELVQTIVQLRELQDRERAQKLAEAMAPYQRAAVQASTLGQLQNIAGGTTNPGALSPFASQLAPQGLDPNVLATIFGGTPTSTATTQSAAVAQGRNNPQASELDQHAAQQALTGTHETPGSQFMDQMSHNALSMLNSLPPDQQHQITLGFLQRQATGQNLTEAALDDVFMELPEEDKKLVVKMRQGLILTPAEQEQLSIARTNAISQRMQVTANAAAQQAQAQAALGEVAARYGQQAQKDVNDLLFKRDALLQKLTTTSATLTSEGRVTLNQQINAYNEQLRKAAPEVYGPQGKIPLVDIPIGSTVGTTGVGQAIGQTLRNKY